MNSKPSVLFISCTSETSESIIKLVLNKNELDSSEVIEENIKLYPWHINNKYYTADVNLAALSKKTISTEQFADSVEAVVVLFDSKIKSGLEAVESWLPFIKVFSPEIKILVCENCPEVIGESEGITKLCAQEWCVNTGFELVEIHPVTDASDDEVEDDFPETTGVKRIIQALHAHVWPNLTLKSTSSIGLSSNVSEDCGNEGNRDVDVEDSGVDQRECRVSIEASLDELLENDGGFSELFSQLHEMKSRVSSLSGDDRKAAAEQMVMAFWRAMGGDEEELED